MTWSPTPPTRPGRYSWRGGRGSQTRTMVLVQDLVGPGLVHGVSRVRAEELGGEWGGPADEATRLSITRDQARALGHWLLRRTDGDCYAIQDAYEFLLGEIRADASRVRHVHEDSSPDLRAFADEVMESIDQAVGGGRWTEDGRLIVKTLDDVKVPPPSNVATVMIIDDQAPALRVTEHEGTLAEWAAKNGVNTHRPDLKEDARKLSNAIRDHLGSMPVNEFAARFEVPRGPMAGKPTFAYGAFNEKVRSAIADVKKHSDVKTLIDRTVDDIARMTVGFCSIHPDVKAEVGPAEKDGVGKYSVLVWCPACKERNG